MISHKQKKTKKKRVLSSGQLSTDVSPCEMGLKSVSSDSAFDPDYIKELVNDIRKFSHMQLYLKEAILSDCFKEVIYIRLDELLRVLKSILNKHQNFNSLDLQNATETLIAKVKAVNFTDVNEENKNDLFREVFSSMETLAFTFGHVLTNFLMGDVGNDSVFRLPVSQESKSSENVSVESLDSSSGKGNFSPIELDSMLLKNTDSVELALSYIKAWSKYTKNVVSWVEKKLNLELESSRNIVKLAEATRTNFGLQEFMPLQSVFASALTNDIESSRLLQQKISALQANKFVQPLLGRKNEMEKQRKEIKELWKQEQNKLLETETALKKAKLLCTQRQDEYEKAKSSMCRAEEEHQSSSGGLAKNGNKQLEKKRRLEEEALQKVEEANELYKVCVINVEERRNDLEIIKRAILTQLQKLVFQCDLTLKAVTVNLFHMEQVQSASLANSLQSFYDRAKLYDPGQEYSKFVKATNSTEEEKVDGSVTKPSTSNAHTSGFGPADSLEDVVRLPHSSDKIEEDTCSTSADAPGSSFVRSWTFGMVSDSESTGGSSESRSLDSESISPGDFHRKLPRTPSSGTMSSADDLDEREPPSPSEGPNSVGMYKKTLMSKAALTHKFRKWRSPTKCRDCEGIVVFQGVECEECLLVCHRKCLETLVIICGHQKLPSKAQLFGAEFIQAAKKEPDGIPCILKICVSEIESRALCVQGIYRICGNKIKTEKLCQALENGMHLVDISEFSSHDICDVLKLYLRQLPEPFILFRLYKEFIDLAKEIQHVNEEQETKKDHEEDKKWPSTCIEINRILLKSKDLLRQLPTSNFNSLHYLIMHLNRVVDHSDENKMNSRNLGVIFGPSLIRPRPTSAPVTISSLAEYSHQARLVEFLITYSQKIFDGSLQPQDVAMCTSGNVAPQVDQACHLKSLLSSEERDPEHFRTSLFFSSKEDMPTAESENQSLDSVASLEESAGKQNASEKGDASLPDQRLEPASPKMEDVSKTSKPFTVRPGRETYSALERDTPKTKSRPSSENVSMESVDSSSGKGNFSPIELDSMLSKNTDTVKLALSYVKIRSKYTKNIVSWVETKLNLELESSRNIVKLAEATRTNFGLQEFMPLQSVFASALTNDIESSRLLQQKISALQTNEFVQPLLERENEMEKQRKEIKELWEQEQNKVLETETALKKAKLLRTQHQDEYEKAKSSMCRAEEEHQSSSGGLAKNGNKQLEKKQRLEEEALQKVEEADELYKVCVINVEERRNDLEIIKRAILIQLQKLVFQCDLTLKAVTVNLFHMEQVQSASLANDLQSFCDRVKLYDPGQEYNKFLNATNSTEEEKVDGSVTKPSTSNAHTSGFGPADSLEDVVHLPHSSDKIEEATCSTSADAPVSSFVRSWRFGMVSDSESTGGSSESRFLGSESISPGEFHRKLPRTPSRGSVSPADDLDEGEPPSTSEGPTSVGTVQTTLFSKAALTHTFRKWKSPTKCRDCERFVVFHGLRCEDCLLVCHQKCLETLVIICGHEKLPEKVHLFGAEFTEVAKKEPDGIPCILKICVSEIESRALCLQAIYRDCGSKIRTRKLCRALENGMHLVDISEFSSRDICDVLKLYLRQLPEPFILFRFYEEFIDLAKEIEHVNEEQETKKNDVEDKKLPSTCIEINQILKSKKLLKQLPESNFNSLHYLIMHLKRVVDHSDENKMNSRNLGVIFGPSLIRPRPTSAPVTISSLAEYSHQARLVEFLITYSQRIFDGSLQPQDVAMCTSGNVVPQVDQACHLKSLLSPEERDPEHFRTSLFFSSKEDMPTAESENQSPDSVASLEESAGKQNASEKGDASLPDQRLESASPKMKDVSKTSKPFTVRPGTETYSALERDTPKTKSRPSSENVSMESVDSTSGKGNFSPIELDSMLSKNTDTVKLALSYVKIKSKYTKNIVSWVETKLNLELESSRNIVKLAEATRTNFGLQEFMPLQSVFASALTNDIESSRLLQQKISALQANEFVQPLLERENEVEKQRKEIKELWEQEQNKVLETETALKKAKLLCTQRQDEYEKAKSSTCRAEEEHQSSSGGLAKNGNKQLEKKQRLEEEALQKVEEANELYKVCVINVEERRNDLEIIKRAILIQLQKLVFQCDLTLKAVTVNLFHMEQVQSASLANDLQSFCDRVKLYDPGQEYNKFVNATNSTEGEKVDGSVTKPSTSNAHTSGFGPADSLEDVVHLPHSSDKIEEATCSTSADAPGSSFVQSWTFGMVSDSESTGGSSESRSLDSESISPGEFYRKLPRTPSSGSVSSADDLDEREPPSPSEGPTSVGTVQTIMRSKAACTHKFRKWRSPTKCRDCERFVGFHGLRCEDCLLVCHQKCLETLVIICGHEKLPEKVHLFGAEFTEVAKREPDGIPYILKICVSEIERRALCVQGIYRICGNKIRTEKLCRALENGMHLIDISEFSSHDICDVLKLYLRQLPEPFILFRFYEEFIDLAKEIEHVNEEQETKKDDVEDKKLPSTCIEINQILKSKKLLKQLPESNFNSLHYLIMHLKRVVDHSDENKMNSGNLGVIFGPSLIRRNLTSAPVTISSLAEYSHKARLVKFLITYSQRIFDSSLQPQDVAMCTSGNVVPQVDQACHLKSLLSPEERDPEHFRTSLFFSSKEDMPTAESENQSPDSVASLEESAGKQNASEKGDASLPDQRLEPASPKMEDVSKTSKPFTVRPGTETYSALERDTPKTKSRPVTLNLFQVQPEAISLANDLQSFRDRAKLHDPGQEYREFVKATNSTKEEKVDGSVTKPSTSNAHTSGFGPADSLEDVVHLPHSSDKIEEATCSTSADAPGSSFVRSWRMMIDSENTGGSSEFRFLGSESISPGEFHQKLPRTPSRGSVSPADDLDEGEPPSTSEGLTSVGTVQTTLMITAACTHKFRKWRSPTKCRNCERFVGFHGLRCEDCLLVCHQKCLETLVIICGHEKLPEKVHLFGAEFTEVAKKEPDGIPYILKICVSEIERRGLCIEGIYRDCGNKIRREKLCRALENGMHFVDISKFSSHDITDVLKLYLRKLPEPFILFRLYKKFKDLAQEIQHVNEEQETKTDDVEDKIWSSRFLEINHILLKSKNLLKQLPESNFNSLHYLIMHLKRVVDHSDENKVDSKTLEMIFGPALFRPRRRRVPGTICSLVLHPHQMWLFRFLITYSQRIFDGSLQPQDVAMCTTGNIAPQADQGCQAKRLLSPEERDPEHSTKSLFFSSKKDMPTAESENQSPDSVASLEESAGKQNASEKGDASLPGEFHRKLPRTPSRGSVSPADDLDEREPPSTSEGLTSVGTVQTTLMITAACTHKFRKWRSPTKCRNCERFVGFHGLRCEDCLLVCHQKCLETLVIICGHEKLPEKVHLFGAEFTEVAKKEPDGIPYILKICVSEIERRGLCIEGIYRDCGNKIRREKLCRALENGMHFVDISKFSSHDITDVLKLYLRKLPEPFILFRLYKKFKDLAQEIQHVNEEQETKTDDVEDKIWSSRFLEINHILLKSKNLLKQLPESNFNSLHYLIMHLKRVLDHSDENKIDSKTLEMIFGPALFRPRRRRVPGTICSLVLHPHQMWLFRFLITYSQRIFDGSLQPQDVAMCTTGNIAPQADQGCQAKRLLSPEERDPEHSTKSLFFSSKKDMPTAESENQSPDSVASLEESAGKQNASEKGDASLPDQRLESASPKMEDVSKTSKPFTVRPGTETYSALERDTPKTKSRPVSLPIDRLLLLAPPPPERNGRNMGNVNSDKLCKTPTFEGVNTPTTCCKFGGFDQQTLQNTGEKQYEQKGLNAKTALIVPNALREGGVRTSLRISGDHLVSATQPSKPCPEPVRSARQVSEGRSSDSCPAAPVRAPRTLQPQHWTTFYKPRAPAGSVRGAEEKPVASSPKVPPGAAHTSQEHVLKSVSDSENAPAPCPLQPTSKPKENWEERDLPDVHPACQRPRLKRMQQFEDLEDEAPQFV